MIIKKPFGSFLSNAGKTSLETADNKKVTINKNTIQKIALKLLGIPHIGMRLRSSYVLDFLNPKKGQLILEAGCGPGIYSLYIATKGSIVHAVDLNSKKINKAKGLNNILNLNIDFREESITNLPYKDNFFDKVLCSEVLEHIKEDKKAMKEISRVTKNKGIIILSVPAKNKFNRKNMKRFGHIRSGYSFNEIKDLAKANNLKIIKIKSILCFFGKFAWIINRKLFFSKILTGVLFYPLYIIALVDKILNINYKPIDYIVKLQKNEK